MRNFVKITFRLRQDENGFSPPVETLWGKETNHPRNFIIDSIPFFTTEVSHGDIVETVCEGKRVWAERVARKSGNSLIRVHFLDKSIYSEVKKDLELSGCKSEWLDRYQILAISIPPGTDLSKIQEYLESKARTGLIEFEELVLRH